MPDTSSSGFQYGLSSDLFHQTALISMGRMNMAGLRPDHDVLDIGCGVGRTARYLCDYLDKGARYEGFDVSQKPVQWCETHITPLFPNFHFQYIPLFNTTYNPDPTLQSASEFRFPYPDQSFDFVFAHSVFTHLLPDTTVNYLHEINRVLRNGGISYSTWILFNDESPDYPHPVTAQMHRDSSGTFAVLKPTVPEVAVGFDENFVRQSYLASGLHIVEPVHPGFRIQDVIVAIRPRSPGEAANSH